jgi:PAS domain S-box-containing protein
MVREWEMNLQMNSSATIKTIGPSYEALQKLSDDLCVENCEPPSITLDERGMILDCSTTSESFFGYSRRDLVWRHVSSLFPQLMEIELVQKGQFNPLLTFLCRCEKHFQAQNLLGDTFPCNLNFVHLEHNGKRILRMFARPAEKLKA